MATCKGVDKGADLLRGEFLQGERRQLQPSDPAFGACLDSRYICGRKGQSHHLLQKSCGFVCGEAQVSGAHFAELTTRSHARQRQGWVDAAGDDKMKLRGQMVKEEGKHFMYRPGFATGFDDMVVVENQQAALRHLREIR